MADNAEIKIVDEGLDNLTLAFQIAFCKYSKGAEGYSVGKNELVFYWTNPKVETFTKLPFKMDYKKAAQFAFDWLEQVDYPKEPNHDGSNGKGWVVYRDYCGHVNGHWSAIVAVKPNWAMYGK